jgi:hypothetical protein
VRCDRARILGAVTALALLSLAEGAIAQSKPAGNREAAARLFQEGKALLDAGQPIEACEKLVESDKLEKAVGTLGLLAACNEQQGRVATAHAFYLEAAARAKAQGDPRAQFAAERAEALRPKVPWLLLRLPVGTQGARVTKNGELVHPERIGSEFPVDPGTFEIAAQAPGKLDFKKVVTAKQGHRLVVDITFDVPRPLAATKIDDAGTFRTLAFVAGGVGVAGLAVGTGFGVMAMSQHDDSKELCNAQNQCTPEGGSLRDKAKTSALVSTIGFGVGIAGVAAGAVLFFTLGRSKAPSAATTLTPIASREVAGAVWSGTF